MRHFDFLADDERQRLFLREPQDFDRTADHRVLAMGLGATLYSPGTRPALAADITRSAASGVLSTVLCLEDAIADHDVATGQQNVIDQLRRYAVTEPAAPMVFVRVRSPEQIAPIIEGLGEYRSILTGFVIPKFTGTRGASFMDTIEKVSDSSEHPLLVMPVIESPEIIFSESRMTALLEVRDLLDSHRNRVLAVRLGATDLSSVYGLRRARDLTIYDVRMVADVIADVVNVFGRGGDAGYLITGATWEYFTGGERLFKPQLRESSFAEHADRALRAELIAKDLDTLIREVVLDKANGIAGKTVIHPSHVAAVHALAVVSHEEYCDAQDILATSGGGGVAPSAYGNKMNESKPHFAWAQRIMLRAQVFGVANADISYVDVLGAWLHP